MDDSSLSKAHDHARAAHTATQQSESTVAINEHALAAGEFANAAKNTSSLEALRTLKLLEEHHQRLSELLKIPYNQRAHSTADLEEKETGDIAAAEDATHDATSTEAPATKAEHDQQSIADTTTSAKAKSGNAPPSLAQQKRIPSRPMSTSIASNLASARGIRSQKRVQPVPPSVTNDQAPGNLEVSPRRENSSTASRSKMQNVLEQSSSSRPGWAPPVADAKGLQSVDEARELFAPPTGVDASDDNYSRFYNAFGGIINRLSAPLAFAGLPLVTEDSSAQQSEDTPEQTFSAKQQQSPAPSAPLSPAARRTKHKSSAAQPEPDLSKIYSRATMRAVTGQNPNESFYVVPTSGHTMSYANILNYADKEKRRMEASMHAGGEASLFEEEEDDFVDARETPSHSPNRTRRSGLGSSSSGGGTRADRGRGERASRTGTSRTTGASRQKTAEELAMENKSLKEVLDKLSRRLHAFEASAQNSHLALAESMRIRRPGSPTPSSLQPGSSAGTGGGGGGDDDNTAGLRSKNKELEEQIVQATKKMEQMEHDQQKLEHALTKYREKWDILKAGAKKRRTPQAGSAGAEASSEGNIAAASEGN